MIILYCDVFCNKELRKGCRNTKGGDSMCHRAATLALDKGVERWGDTHIATWGNEWHEPKPVLTLGVDKGLGKGMGSSIPGQMEDNDGLWGSQVGVRVATSVWRILSVLQRTLDLKGSRIVSCCQKLLWNSDLRSPCLGEWTLGTAWHVERLTQPSAMSQTTGWNNTDGWQGEAWQAG